MDYRNNLSYVATGCTIDSSLFALQSMYADGRMAACFRALARPGQYGLLSVSEAPALNCEIDARGFIIHSLSCFSPKGNYVYLPPDSEEDPVIIPIDTLQTNTTYRLRLYPAQEPTVRYGPELSDPYRKAYLRPDHRFLWAEKPLSRVTPSADNALDLAEIKVAEDGSIVFNKEFHPVCLSLQADHYWLDLRKELIRLFRETRKNVEGVARKSVRGRGIAEQQLHAFSAALSYDLSAQVGFYMRIGVNHSPEDLFEPWERAAGLLENFLNITNEGGGHPVDQLIVQNTQVFEFLPNGATRHLLTEMTRKVLLETPEEQVSKGRTIMEFVRKFHLLFDCLARYQYSASPNITSNPPTPPPGGMAF